jgi:hypothetical protein
VDGGAGSVATIEGLLNIEGDISVFDDLVDRFPLK